MTVVEFYDKTAVENIASTLLCSPDKVIFVGDNEKRMRRSKEIYSQIAAERGIEVDFSYRKVNRNNLMQIVQVLCDIVEKNPDCVFDLEGGEELFLVAVGIVFQKNGGQIQLHRYNIHTDSLTDCDADGTVCNTSSAHISVEENIRIYGGRIVGDDELDAGTYSWDFTDDFIKDIELMWSLCVKNTGRWNSQINCISKLCRESEAKENLSFRASMEIVLTLMKKSVAYVNQFTSLLRSLEDCGIIKNLFYNDRVISFDFKNSQVKRCLTMAGRLLELYVTVNAMRATDKKGERIYNDVRTGVYIDWDSVVAPEFSTDVANEIDVMLMKGLTPVFVSCKNGHIGVDELYKLSVVAERFGGKYARKVIFASDISYRTAKGRYLKARAGDMGIKIINDVDKMSPQQLDKEIKSLWRAP